MCARASVPIPGETSSFSAQFQMLMGDIHEFKRHTDAAIATGSAERASIRTNITELKDNVRELYNDRNALTVTATRLTEISRNSMERLESVSRSVKEMETKLDEFVKTTGESIRVMSKKVSELDSDVSGMQSSGERWSDRFWKIFGSVLSALVVALVLGLIALYVDMIEIKGSGEKNKVNNTNQQSPHDNNTGSGRDYRNNRP